MKKYIFLLFFSIASFLSVQSEEWVTHADRSCQGGIAKYCQNGGCGSASCSIDVGAQILGFGGSIGGSVSAHPGYFACCSLQCKSWSNDHYFETKDSRLVLIEMLY